MIRRWWPTLFLTAPVMALALYVWADALGPVVIAGAILVAAGMHLPPVTWRRR